MEGFWKTFGTLGSLASIYHKRGWNTWNKYLSIFLSFEERKKYKQMLRKIVQLFHKGYPKDLTNCYYIVSTTGNPSYNRI